MLAFIKIQIGVDLQIYHKHYDLQSLTMYKHQKILNGMSREY